jgi:hypothetical protein
MSSRTGKKAYRKPLLLGQNITDFSVKRASSPKTLPLPDQRAFGSQPLPEDIRVKIETAYKRIMDPKLICIRSNYMTMREQLKKILNDICNEEINLNNGLYDFSTVPRLVIVLIEEISREIYQQYRNPEFK